MIVAIYADGSATHGGACMVHNPAYDFNDRNLASGCRSIAQGGKMQIYGYPDEESATERTVADSKTLAEITLLATPEELRRIAKFLESCASGIEKRGKSWEHEHLSDYDHSFEESPHFVVFNEEGK